MAKPTRAEIRRYLNQASRESLAAEGITWSDKQWRRIVSAARNAQPQRSAAPSAKEITDPREVAESLTQAYIRAINARRDKG
ncbi:hypothetical protein J2T57_002781 [Natronocella acetinitrilica]|uniref:Uncharacterized protein n=1 Tax=Natronocella acetinitrilica TaxID=414046 RepID=A0AAE3G4G1_9GAMM|nr:hypothetical protein [Natronocella acetinitrilica]